MSYQQKQQEPRQILTQEQSRVFDGMSWSEEKTKWYETKTGKSYPRKWKECMFSDAPREATEIFDQLRVGEKEKVLSFSLIYLYGKGRDRFFQSKATSSGSAMVTAPGMRTTTTTPVEDSQDKEDKWDKIRARQDDRDKEFETRHNESMQKMDDMIFSDKALREEIQALRNDIRGNTAELKAVTIALQRSFGGLKE